MSTETLAGRSAPSRIYDTWFNVIKGALSSHFLPRNASGVPTDEAGFLGSPALRWLKAYIACGEWTTGDIKVRHSFNGEAAPGEGWMLCDGRVISQANYDAEHGAGAWATYVGTSPINGKRLPDFTNRYPIGKATTTQDGSSPITAVGNAGNVVDLSHTQQWFVAGGASTADQYYNSSGTPTNMVGNLTGKSNNSPPGHATQASFAGSGGVDLDYVLENLYLKTGGDTAKSLKPDSIETLFYMRVI